MHQRKRPSHGHHPQQRALCPVHWPARMLKAVAWAVIVCFSVRCLTPAVLAAETLSKQSHQVVSSPAESHLQRASDALIALENTLDRMNRRLQGKYEFAWQATLAKHALAQKAPAKKALIQATPAKPTSAKQSLGEKAPAKRTLVKMTVAPPPAAATRANLAPLQAKLRTDAATFNAQRPAVKAFFGNATSHLQAMRTTAVVQRRAKAQAEKIARLFTQLDTLLAAIKSAKTDAAYKQAVAAADAFMHAHSSKPKRAKFDPKHLAFDPTGVKSRKALTDPTAIRKALRLPAASKESAASATTATSRSLAMASTQPATSATAATSPSLPADLAPTEDVQITAAIKAKAAALDNNPLKIYQFVRNHVEYLPTYGSIEGSDYTLQTMRGNAMDQASLLIALLRAAHIPARYVYGTIRVPIAQVENWVGNVSDPKAALNLMGQGGIPVLGLAQGGIIKYAQIEHVWVEAQIGYAPSRGAVTTAGDTWVPMDPSFKQYTYSSSTISTSLYGNINEIASAVASSGTISADGSSATAFNFKPLSDAVIAFRQALAHKITADKTHPTIYDLLGTKSIVPEKLPILAGSLPYHKVTEPITFDTVPDSLRIYAELQLYRAGVAADFGNSVFDYKVSLIRLARSSLMLSAKGSTAADQSTWDAMTGASFAPYVINADEVLTLDGAVVAKAKGIALGDSYTLGVDIKGAGIDKSAQFNITAGDAMEVGFDTGGVTAAAAQQLLARTDYGTLEGNLFLAAKSYWFSYDLFSQMLSKIHHTVDVRLPSVGVFAAPISVTYSFGIPAKATYKSHSVDIKLSRSAVASIDGSSQTRRTYVEADGVLGSFLEGLVPEVLFHKPMGVGNNTTRLLQLANTNSVPIHYITASNYASQIPLLNQPQSVLLDVANAINAGEDVIIPRDPQTNHSWSGTGYIMRDPATGSADYRINGRFNGDTQTECGRSTRPVPVTYPAVSFISILLLMTSPIYINDNGDINTGGIAVAVLAIAALVLLTVATAGAADAVVATVGVVGRRVALGLIMLLAAGEAFAGEVDSCSCTPQALGYHRGGNKFHDFCADVAPPNKVAGTDWVVSGKAFDALTPDDQTLWEVKTGNYSQYPEFLKKVELDKFLKEYQDDAENAFSCGKAFVFGVTDPGLAAAMEGEVKPVQRASIQTITCE